MKVWLNKAFKKQLDYTDFSQCAGIWQNKCEVAVTFDLVQFHSQGLKGVVWRNSSQVVKIVSLVELKLFPVPSDK